ncbi:hypothetical protein GJAV_G00175540 [Gymnothorax javanicus]|nr:hypothetical protein GJAV_G00175540 [Gymnothorax javanicus]
MLPERVDIVFDSYPTPSIKDSERGHQGIDDSSHFKTTLWMDAGTTRKNNRRLFNLTAIGKELGVDLCKSLPAFLAFTEYDYTFAFVRKREVLQARQNDC